MPNIDEGNNSKVYNDDELEKNSSEIEEWTLKK